MDPKQTTEVRGPRTDYLATLDGWRAIAIALVLLSHGIYSFVHAGLVTQTGWLAVVANHGLRGVDIFFALSGFLITSRLMGEAAATGRMDLRAFYLRRAFRILPLYVAYLVVLVVIGSLSQPLVTGRELVACALFFRNYLSSVVTGSFTGHFWSLCVEEHFYVLWPVLLVVAGARRGLAIALVLALTIGVWRAVEARFALLPLPPDIFDKRTEIRADGLMWGAFAACAMQSPRVRGLASRIFRLPVWLALVALSVLTEVVNVPAVAAVRAILFSVVIAASPLQATNIAGKVLEWAPIRWFGRISYSLYVWQGLFLKSPTATLTTDGDLTRAPLNLVLAVALATLSYYLLEQPFIRVGRRFKSRPALASRMIESQQT